MTKEQLDREMNYRLALYITKLMLSKGIVSEREYRKIDTICKDRYRPCLGSLRS